MFRDKKKDTKAHSLDELYSVYKKYEKCLNDEHEGKVDKLKTTEEHLQTIKKGLQDLTIPELDILKHNVQASAYTGYGKLISALDEATDTVSKLIDTEKAQRNSSQYQPL